MKKLLFHSAMLAMIFAAAVMATSCQKEKEKEETMKTTVSHFNPENLQIEDMNAYLEGFKEKMENAEAKGETEAMSIDEAAWHITSLANYQFAKANAPHDDLRFDTLYSHVNITDGMISMTDLNATYQEIAYAIKDFKKNVACENPNFRYIFISIADNGNVRIDLQTIFGNGTKFWGDTLWYYSSTFDFSDYFDITGNTSYPANGYGMYELKRVLNLVGTYTAYLSGIARVYYTYRVTDTFYFKNYVDPHGSDFSLDSRLYASTNTFNSDIGYDNMCYALDSYTGLAWENRPLQKEVVAFGIRFQEGEDPENLLNDKWQNIGNHKLGVTYGFAHVNYY